MKGYVKEVIPVSTEIVFEKVTLEHSRNEALPYFPSNYKILNYFDIGQLE